jgi:molybdenum cofactor biosynthesis enzyme MoaA
VEIGTIGIPPSAEDLRPLPLPQTVVMNFAKVCNLWCAHCFYPAVARKREADGRREERYLSPSIFGKVVEEVAGWEARPVLRIVSDGEPLLNPDAMDMIEAAAGRGIPTVLTTNGIPLTAPVSERLLAMGIDGIDVSIDAATAESYGKVRGSRNGHNYYERVERQVKALIGRKAALGPECRTKVIVNMIDQPLVHREVELFSRQWSEWGADVVLIRPFHSTSAQTTQKGVSTPAADVSRFPCKYPFTRLNVGFDAEGHSVVYYCSHDWEEKTVVGDLGGAETLRSIWTGKAMEEIRRRHLGNDFPAGSFCGRCPDWYLGWGKSHHQLVKPRET